MKIVNKEDDKRKENPSEEQQKPQRDEQKYWTGRNPQEEQQNKSDKPKGPKLDFSRKNRVALGFFIFLIITFVFMLFSENRNLGSRDVPYSSFLSYVEANQVAAVEIQDKDTITFALKNNMTATTRIPYDDANLMETLKNHNVQVTGTVKGVSFLQIILQLLPWVIFIGFTVMLWRQTRSGVGGNVMAFSKSRAKEYMESDLKPLTMLPARKRLSMSYRGG